ncbi:hypothetical protein KP509_29G023600 [Ceratopteris richardii]|nr:hypothetical protein KP509_29G023600 [Ceratopteris richardii]KAH7291600.1 hypothetical protein KP509_29G023600 [Ceratopteris richardii]KAH7291601.1 hypothetical protein KP509_29G023600 [Ceratopteris richardii]
MPIYADYSWPTDGFDHSRAFLGRKRPWHFCTLSYGGLEPLNANLDFLGQRNFSKVPDISEGSDFPFIDNWGSGDSSNGGDHGEGGSGGHGNDDGGLQDPEFDGRGFPLSVNWHVLPENQEDSTTQVEAESHNMDISGCSSPNHISRDGLREMIDSQNANINKEAHVLDDTHGEVLYRLSEYLNRVLAQLFLKFRKSFPQQGDCNQNTILQHDILKSVHDSAQPYYSIELEDHFEDIDSTFADNIAAMEMKENFTNLLDKVRRLNLGLTGHQDPQVDDSPFKRLEEVHNSIQKQTAGHDSIDSKVSLRDETKKKEVRTISDLRSGRRPSLMDMMDNMQLGWINHIAHDEPKELSSNLEGPANQIDEQKMRTLINEAVTTAFKELANAGVSGSSNQNDMETLRNLKREIFAELLKLREKLDQLLQERQSNNARHTRKTNIQGEVKVGTAVVVLEDSSSRHSRGSLEQAGLRTGVDVRLIFETPFRDQDLLITEFNAGQDSSVGGGRVLGGPMSLGKVQYLAHVHDNMSVSFVPLGAQGMDVTDIVNPMQDQGLTSFSSRGPAHFDHCRGSAIGATWCGSSLALSAAQYLSGWGNQAISLGTSMEDAGPLCLSTLGQVLLQPTEGLIFSLSGLHRFWPTPPLPSSTSLHWSEIGPLIIPKMHSLNTRSTLSSEDSFLSHCNSMSSHWGVPESEHPLEASDSKGTSQLSVAVATELEVGMGLSMGAWAQVDDALQDVDKGNFQWSVSLAKNSKKGVDWGMSIGGSKPDWSAMMSEQEMFPSFIGSTGDSCGSQLQAEAFIRFNCGNGLTLQPGLLYLLNKHSQTPAFVVRSSLLF